MSVLILAGYDLFETYKDKYPKLAHCILKDHHELLTVYDFLAKH